MSTVAMSWIYQRDIDQILINGILIEPRAFVTIDSSVRGTRPDCLLPDYCCASESSMGRTFSQNSDDFRAFIIASRQL
jgi:hypothetical protein